MHWLLGACVQIARGFSRYVARLAFYNSNPSDRPFLIDNVDWMAFGCVLVLTAILSAGVRESSLLITGKHTAGRLQCPSVHSADVQDLAA